MRINGKQERVKIILIDDKIEHLMGVKELINMETDFEVVDTATNVVTALALIKKHNPDVVLTDINMPDKDGLTAITEIEKINPDIKVIALTGYDDQDLIFRALKLGAKAYILKTMASSQLVLAIEEVMQGKVYLPSSLSTKFFEYFRKKFKEETPMQNEENLLKYLTQREEEVLELLTAGVTYKGVAQKLFISETTVKTHVNNIFQKLQVNDRTQAVLYAINNGFGTRKKYKMAV